MTKCKHCGSTNVKLRKSWLLKGSIKDPKTGKPFIHRIFLYDCLACGKTFRIAMKE